LVPVPTTLYTLHGEKKNLIGQHGSDQKYCPHQFDQEFISLKPRGSLREGFHLTLNLLQERDHKQASEKVNLETSFDLGRLSLD
jgi:hypothetical protein